MASPTVLRFCTSLSGIFTPNFSSAATTTSTIDSESTSRSSVKDFSGVTSSGLTPATSSRISARPVVISSWVMRVPCRGFGWTGFRLGLFSCLWRYLGLVFMWYGSGMARSLGLRAPDDLPGVGEATAEAEQQHRRPGRDLAALDQLGQGQDR